MKYWQISADIGKYRQISADIGKYRQVSANIDNIGKYRLADPCQNEPVPHISRKIGIIKTVEIKDFNEDTT